MFGPDYKRRVDGREMRLALGGDKGYRFVKCGAGAPHESIGTAKLVLTKSASDANDDDAR